MQPEIDVAIVDAVELLLRTTNYAELNRPVFYTCPILKDIVLMRYDYSQEAINAYEPMMRSLKSNYISQINKELKHNYISQSSDAFIMHQVTFTGKTYGESRQQWLNFIIQSLTMEESACLVN